MGAEQVAAQKLVNTKELVKSFRSIEEFSTIKTKQRRFIIAWCGTGRISAAADISGVPWFTHYNWLKADPNYKIAFDKATELFADFAEGDVFHRAFIGEEHTKVRMRAKGEVVIETFKQKSDVLAMFALKGMRPKYRDNWQINTFVGPQSLNIGYSSAPPAIDVTPDKDKDNK